MWKRRGLQVGLVAGGALAFVGGGEPDLAAAPRPCALETECTFEKPLLGLVLDYSTAMNEPFDGDSTRWEAAVASVTEFVEFDNGYVAENFILGLTRFGHDPDPNVAGTKIAGDTSGLVDGQRLDVPWYDPRDPDKKYLECDNGDAIVAALAGLPAPLGGAPDGIGAWTSGALQFAHATHTQALADHPNDFNRKTLFVVLTTGRWTDATGTMKLAPPAQDPKLVAADMWINEELPTYVVALGGPADQPLADALAEAGGPGASVPASAPEALNDAMKGFIQHIQALVDPPICTPGIPRVMVLLDASSSMLGTDPQPGATRWDQVRGVLAGDDAIFDQIVNPNITACQQFHFGLSVFGGADEEQLLVQYGSAHEDNFAWALDPANSCVAPGCVDPYAAPPIKWTAQDGGQLDPPGFDTPTISHMPSCDFSAQQPDTCVGSQSLTHLGLELVEDNLASFKSQCLALDAPVPCLPDTQFTNVLIVDGTYDSSDAQVKAPLLAMHAAGVTTRVIGFGDDLDLDQLDKLAAWGSGDLLDPAIALDGDELRAAFAAILKPPLFDPCCNFKDCNTNGEGFTETDTEGDSSGSSGSGDTGTTAADESDTGAINDTGSETSAGSSSTAGLDDTGAPQSDSSGDPQATTGGQTPTDPTDPNTPTSGGGPTTATSTGDTDEGPSGNGPDVGCSCDSTRAAPPPELLVLLLGLLARRRRRA